MVLNDIKPPIQRGGACLKTRLLLSNPFLWRKCSMARKVLNRKALREEAEAVEALEKAEGVTKKSPATKKAPVKRKKKVAAEVRVKLFYGVFNQSLKRVALYDFTQQKQAEKKAVELSKDGKSPHFVQKVKEAIEE